jgi:hypothetical protein
MLYVKPGNLVRGFLTRGAICEDGDSVKHLFAHERVVHGAF